MTWFQQLFGFPETDYSSTQSRFTLHRDQLTSTANGRSFGVGSFRTPTVAALRQQAQGLCPGRLSIHHEVVGDVLELHARPENRGAMFQAASQFNCLEFASPSMTPEDGVTGYSGDPTQGPACALAAAAGTVYRNYFAPVDGHIGQTADRQLNLLGGVLQQLGPAGELVTIRNGYTFSDESRLTALNAVLQQQDREQLIAHMQIGTHTGVEVTFASRFQEPEVPQQVSQAYCSALSCGYSEGGLETWRPLATLVLDAAYEATLLAAVIDRAQGTGSGKVWLTFLGGGVFNNHPDWIAQAIGRALRRAHAHELDVRIAHYRRLDSAMMVAIEQARSQG